jgi:hypothetical protein
MGLKETVKAGAAAAFKALGNLKIPATFYSVTATGYNPTTGASTETVTSVTVDVIRSEYSKEEMLWSEHDRPNKGEFKLMVLADDIDDPKLIDYVVMNGRTYDIVEIKIDPADAVYEFGVKTKV